MRDAHYHEFRNTLTGWVGGKEVELTEIVCVIKEAEDVYIVETKEDFLLIQPPSALHLERMKRDH